MMLRNTLVFILIIEFQCIFGQSLIFTTPVDIATGNDNLRPRVVLTQNDIPVVIWGSAGSNPVYLARYNGTSFNTPIQVSPAGVDPYCATWTGPDIASNGDDLWVVFDANVNGYKIFSMKSSDGGVTFSDTVNVGDNSGLNRFSSIGANPIGNPMIVFMDHDPGWANPNYVVTNSLDGGVSWELAVSASNSITGDEVCDCCPPEIIANNDYQVALFRNNENNIRDVWATYSIDDGISFNGSDIDFSSWNLNACPSSAPHGLIRGDSLLTTWMSGGSGQTRVLLGVSNLNDGSVGSNVEVSPSTSNGVVQNFPRIAGDNQVFGLVYQEYSGGNYDCYIAYSLNGNNAIENTGVILNDEVQGNQLNPDIAYANGVFHIVFQDDKTNTVKYMTATISPVDINEKNTTKMLSVYPNPNKGVAYIDLLNCPKGKSIELIISDISGKKFNTISVDYINNQSIEISMPDIKGVYLLSLSIDGKIRDNIKLISE